MKYSIIVPVYCTEKYIDKCINSLLNQNHSDYEILLIDDKSPDHCPTICDQYAERYKNIYVVHKDKNEGLGFARNTGIKYAKGDYITFVDSDDMISPDFLNDCDKSIKENTDILIYGMRLHYEKMNGKTIWEDIREIEENSASEEEQKVKMFINLNQAGLFSYVCNKMYRREFVVDFCDLFEQTKLIEDFLFNIKAFAKAKHIESINKALYIYRKPEHETLASQYNPEFFELAIRKYNAEKDFLNNQKTSNDKAYQIINYNLIKHLISAIVRNQSSRARLSFSEKLSHIKKMVNEPVVVDMIEDFSSNSVKYTVIGHWIKKKRVLPLWITALFVRSIQFGRCKSIKRSIR